MRVHAHRFNICWVLAACTSPKKLATRIAKVLTATLVSPKAAPTRTHSFSETAWSVGIISACIKPLNTRPHTQTHTHTRACTLTYELTQYAVLYGTSTARKCTKPQAQPQPGCCQLPKPPPKPRPLPLPGLRGASGKPPPSLNKKCDGSVQNQLSPSPVSYIWSGMLGRMLIWLS